jgi:putative Holliday junction resolvase
MDGSEGFQAQRVRRYAEKMRVALAAMGMEIDLVFWDERLTTGEAERVLACARRRRDRAHKQVDAVAAAVILQSYLDEQARRDGSGSEGTGV